MGVDRTSYLLYGFKVEDEKGMDIFDDNYDELMEEEPYSNIFNNSNSDFGIVYDCMCGNYVYIGIVLAELDEYDDDETIELSVEELNDLNTKLVEAMKTWPKYLQDLLANMTPKLYFFIHAY